ncbi:MAG: hypothetical protein WAM28_00535 [Chlamydiales bacterium]
MTKPVSSEKSIQQHDFKREIPAAWVSSATVKKVALFGPPLILAIGAAVCFPIGFTILGGALVAGAGVWLIGSLIAKAIKECRRVKPVSTEETFQKHLNRLDGVNQVQNSSIDELYEARLNQNRGSPEEIENKVKNLVGDNEFAVELIEILSNPDSRASDLFNSAVRNKKLSKEKEIELLDEFETLMNTFFPVYRFERKHETDLHRRVVLHFQHRNIFEDRINIKELKEKIASVVNEELATDIVEKLKNPKGGGVAQVEQLFEEEFEQIQSSDKELLLKKEAERLEVMEMCFAAIREGLTLPEGATQLVDGKASVMIDQECLNLLLIECSKIYNFAKVKPAKTAQEDPLFKWDVYSVNEEGQEIWYLKATVIFEVVPHEDEGKPYGYIEANSLINATTGKVTNTYSPLQQKRPAIIAE